MNGAHLHLLLNHLPVLGTAFGILLLLFALLRKSDELKRVSLGVFVLTALSAVPAYLTGEPAEELVGKLPGVLDVLIEQHEEAALIALIVAGVTGAVALLGLILFRRAETLPVWVVAVSLMLSVATGGLMARTANLGGQIRHTEIRQNAAPSENTGAEAKPKQDEEKEENHE